MATVLEKARSLLNKVFGGPDDEWYPMHYKVFREFRSDLAADFGEDQFSIWINDETYMALVVPDTFESMVRLWGILTDHGFERAQYSLGDKDSIWSFPGHWGNRWKAHGLRVVAVDPEEFEQGGKFNAA